MKRYVTWSAISALACLVILLSSGIASAQATGASMIGTLKDDTGGALPGVTVTATQLETSRARTTVTEANGDYQFPALPPGPYEVKAELAGFQTSIRRGIDLSVNQRAVVNFTLGVGDLKEEVVVTGEAPLVDTTRASVAGLVSEEQVESLPLNARSFIELVGLTNGVNFAETSTGSASRGFGKKIAITGARIMTNNYMLDGTTINDTANSVGSAAGTVAGVETIREFSVITNAYSAEYGRHTGGVISVITKSGTNEIRGSGYEFNRNGQFDSKSYFDKAKPDFMRNQFGYSLGFPLVKDRTFIFTSFEALRETLGKTALLNVPNQNAHNGYLPTAGVLQYVGVDPRIKPFLDSYPLPNGRDFGDGRGELLRAGNIETVTNYVSARVDHKLGENDQIFARYTRDTGSEADPVSQLNVNNWGVTNNQYLTIDETRTISSRILNKLMFGFNHSITSGYDAPADGMTFPLTDFTDLHFDNIVGGITVSGLANWGGGVSNPRLSDFTSLQFKDDLFYTRGNHSMKFGVALENLGLHLDGPMNGAGTYAFQSLKAFMQGTVNTFTSTLPGSDTVRNLKQNLIGLYAQDDIKLSARVTLNAGMRYEFITVPTEKNDKISQIRDYYNPAMKPTDVAMGNPLFENPSLKNFGPRIGLAWDVTGDGKTSVRLGTGAFFDQILPWSYRTLAYRTPPFYYLGNLYQATLGQSIAFPNAFQTQGQYLAAAPQLEGVQYDAKQPTMYKWSLDGQHEMWGKFTVDLGYSGSRGVHLMRADFGNDLVATILPDGSTYVANGAPFINPNFSRMRMRNFDENSIYHAIRAGLNRRFANGFQFQASYTYGKSIDYGSSPESAEFGNVNVNGRYIYGIDPGLSAFDVRQTLMVNGSVDLPGDSVPALGKVIGGWQLSGVWRLSAGYPFSLNAGFKNSRLQYFPSYPSLAAGATNIIDPQNVNKYYDPAAFVLPALGYQGNLGRSMLVGPGVATVDMSFSKEINVARVNNRFAVQLKAEVFNIFNRANFGTPDRNVFNQTTRQASATAGMLTSINTAPRQVQFGVRLVF